MRWGDRKSAWVAAVTVGAALALARSSPAVEVNPGSFQGRTEAAIREFRAAIELEPDLGHGKALFTACAECHQADGRGSANGMTPVIAGQHVSVLMKQLVDFRHFRRWNVRMQGIVLQHELASAQDLLDVASYAASLKWPAPVAADAATQAAQQPGRIVYYRECEACHGRLAEGDLRAVLPRIAGQHYRYLLQQLVETAAGQRPGMDAALVKRIGDLSDAERDAVARYLSQLSPGLTSRE